jgi:hypothetical protein
MKRFVTEYANYKIDEILKNELITEEAKQKAISKIDKAHFYCNKQMITIDEAIKMILNAFE